MLLKKMQTRFLANFRWFL